MKGLSLRIAKDYEAMSRSAAQLIEAELKLRPELILCASAGGSPTGTYALLTRRYEQSPRLFRKLRVLQIDEWAGLGPDNPATCRTYLQNHLLRPLKIDRVRFAGYRSDAADPQRECKRIERWPDKNAPIDVCFPGLGLNGLYATI